MLVKPNTNIPQRCKLQKYRDQTLYNTVVQVHAKTVSKERLVLNPFILVAIYSSAVFYKCTRMRTETNIIKHIHTYILFLPSLSLSFST